MAIAASDSTRFNVAAGRRSSHNADMSVDLSRFAGARVLVTGGTGFIGSHLCRKLAAAGAAVAVITRRQGLTLPHASSIHTADLSDGALVDDLIAAQRPAYVFHLASHVTGSRDLAAVGPTFQGNLLSTVNLLNAVARQGCQRIVLAGSLEEPEQGDAPSSPYAAAKAAASLYARMFFKLYDTPVVTARIFMVYGPGQPDERKLVPYVARSLLAGDTPRVSSGVRPVDWVHVEDVTDALCGCATTPGIEGQTIEIGTGRLTTVRSVVERIAEIVGKREPVFGAIDDRPAEQIRMADSTAIARLLGRPPIALDIGLRETVDWYRTHTPVRDDAITSADI